MTYNSCLAEKMFKEGIGSVISGLVFLSASLTEQLLSLHTLPPLDRCTYYGTDSGVLPLQVGHLWFRISKDEGNRYALVVSYNNSWYQLWFRWFTPFLTIFSCNSFQICFRITFIPQLHYFVHAMNFIMNSLCIAPNIQWHEVQRIYWAWSGSSASWKEGSGSSSTGSF